MAKKKVVFNDITFDSKLEAQIYEKCLMHENVHIVATHKTFYIQDKLEYYNIKTAKKATLRDIKYTPDIIVYIDGVVLPVAIEVKGYARKDYQLRKKLFITKFHEQYHFIELNGVKECDEFLAKH